MKNILSKFLIIFVLLIFNITSLSFADNETENLDSMNYDDEVVPISMEGDTPVVTSELDNGETSSEKNYFYAGESDVNINTPVSGDLFVATTGDVTINTSIGGNAFICASSVTIEDTGVVQVSLFTASKSINIDGVVGLNVYSVSSNINVNGTIGADLSSFSQKANIDGYINGNTNITCEDISISDNSYIGGNLNYTSNNTLNTPDGVINGTVNHTFLDSNETSLLDEIKDFVLSTISFAIFAIVIFIICKQLNCKFINTYQDFLEKCPKFFLYGLLSLIVLLVISFILLICKLTFALSFIVIVLTILLITLASSIVIILLSKLLTEKLHTKFEKVNDTWLTIGLITILCIAYKILKLIPILETILTLIFVIIGVGVLVKNIIPAKTNKNS